jgi:hypothetical protein
VELAFLTLLLKNGADSVSGGVAIDNKWVFKTGLTKDWSRANGVHECLEGRLVFGFPVKTTPFHAEGDESVQRSSEHAKVPDIHPIEVEEAQKGAKFPKGCRSFPVLNTIDFNRVHSNTVFTDDDAEIFDFRRFELALLRLEVKIVFSQNTKDVVNYSTMEF